MKAYKVYVAGKLNDTACGYIQNLSRMCEWAIKVKSHGYSVFVPGLDILLGLLAGDWEYEQYFSNNQPWLECSDAMFLVPGWTESVGTQKEIKLAQARNIPIFSNINELNEWRDDKEHERLNGVPE